MLWNSAFRNKLFRLPNGETCNMREIEWDRSVFRNGGPHIFQDADEEKIKHAFCKEIQFQISPI